MRVCKCWCCLISDTEPKEKYEGKNVHIACLDTYKKQREQQKIDTEQFNLLYDFLIELHGAFEIPSRNIKRLRDVKMSKNIDYKLILEAYQQCEEKMRWFISTVLQGDNSAESINKAMTLMLNDGLNRAIKAMGEKEKKERELLRTQKQEVNFIAIDNITYTPRKKDDRDISDLL